MWDELRLVSFYVRMIVAISIEGSVVNTGAPSFLIVDDNEPLRNIIVRVIRKAAPQAVIQEVAFVRDALHALHGGTFNALVVDYRLPDGDGADVIRWVRAHSMPLPIIAISGLNVDREMEAIGADYILNKPFHIDRLLTIVRTILEETPTV
jgi:DNA-binding response OmpR family regulator